MNFKHAHTIADLEQISKKNIPHIAFTYLETGTDKESAIKRNLEQFNKINFIPKFCLGERKANIATKLFDDEFAAPIGIAPIGLTSLIWPKSEIFLAKEAQQQNIPFCLSTVATATPEEIRVVNTSSKTKWFQLYPPKDDNILKSILKRVTLSGFSTLVVTVDIPSPSRRERSKSTGLVTPFKFNLNMLLDGILNLKWGISTLRNGVPRLKTVEDYTNNNNLNFVSKFVGNRLGGTVDWEYIKKVRSLWSGNLVIKGILHEEDALRAKELGCDAVYISNHGGRQFDGAISPLTALRNIRKVVGKEFPLLIDSGIRSGLDIMKCIYFGADFVFLGRPFMYGVSSKQQEGVERVCEILTDQLRNNMMQMGLTAIADIKNIPDNQVKVFD